MSNTSSRPRAAVLSAVAYTGLSLAAAAAFFAATFVAGDYSWVARIGGATWVFLLSMIILMPLLTPALKKRLGGGSAG